MVIANWRRARRAVVLAIAAAVVAIGATGLARAETTPAPSAAAPVTPPPLPGAKRPPPIVPPSAKETPPGEGTSQSKPSPQDVPPGEAKPSNEPKPSGDASSATTLTLEARPVAILKGQSDWDEGFKTITASLRTIKDSLAKANIKTVGHPMTVFRETDDNGFKFESMIPIDPASDTKTKLDSNVAFGQAPAGKALQFQHRGAYEEIDSTYEAITAYLDEKGFDTKNLFMEEYLNSVKSADDTNFQVDIFVLVK